MSETIEAILAYTHEREPPRPTSFVVVVPAWTDERSHEMMKVGHQGGLGAGAKVPLAVWRAV